VKFLKKESLYLNHYELLSFQEEGLLYYTQEVKLMIWVQFQFFKACKRGLEWRYLFCYDSSSFFVKSNEFCDCNSINRLILWWMYDFMWRHLFFVKNNNSIIFFLCSRNISISQHINICVIEKSLFSNTASTDPSSLNMSVNRTRWHTESSCRSIAVESKSHNNTVNFEHFMKKSR